MGTEVDESDMDHICNLADQVVELSAYRQRLADYLRSRMQAIAPNLTTLVGELVGARLVQHAGSIMNLAKHPASTIQILGAEKALFRALKQKHDTPKYGLIYHASLVGQAQPKHKGKISRLLAAKCALSIRGDALGDANEATIGYDARLKLEVRRERALWDAVGPWAASAFGEDDCDSVSCKLFPKFRDEAGEGLGNHKELFALLGRHLLLGRQARPAGARPRAARGGP